MKVTAVVSTKGGPGKTTVGVNLGAFCADAGIRKFKDMAATAPPAVANMLNMLIAENYGFQNDLAGVTSGTVAELLATKLGLSPERAAELVVAVRLGVAAFNAAKAVAVVVGKAGGAKATGTAGEVAGTGARNPLLDDAIARGGDRQVVNQESVPTCGHNSCGMVLNTLGKEVDVGTFIQKLPPSEKGIFAQDVASLMKSEGVPASAFGYRNVADLARYTSNGTPVVVRVVDKTTSCGFPILLWWMELQLEMAFLLWLFVTRITSSISVLLVSLKEIFG
ncbi:hypothetical protein PSH61_18435 [Pseudomonas rhodesiae]|uniref:ParA family protein n=1 Tax=Pseudomonas rhodesiae TaxID=76760 RepID=UPI00273771B6|nr:hypothetical protein [Pseudomonas rhodesiae]WLI27789.1 hypothetical protein PSH61_18435 [Pseudomonas rhodesiae]